MMSAIGVGAFVGALLVAGRGGLKGLGPWMAWSVVGFGLSLLLFAWSRSFWLSTALLVVAGLSHMIQMTVSLTLVQTMVPDYIRGRALAVFSMIQQGSPPFGALGAGLLSEAVGAPTTVAVGGALTALVGLVYGRSRLSSRAHDADAADIPATVASGGEAGRFATIGMGPEDSRKLVDGS